MRAMKRAILSLVLSAVAVSTVGLVTATQAQARVGAPYLSSGSTGSGVWCVQRIINRLYGWGLTEDSIYGTRTQDAVTAFQSDNGLSRDGIVGPRTGTYLLNAIGGDSYCYRHLPTLT